MNKPYNINFGRFAALMTPTMLRGRLMMAFLTAFMRPIEWLHNRFMIYADDLIAGEKSQVCYLEGLLNNDFDYFERRIYIRDHTVDLLPLLTWGMDTERRTLAGTRGSGMEILRNARGQLDTSAYNFEVVLPAGFYLSEDEEKRLKALLNKNKIASKRYLIVNENEDE
jgi:hypothetical protein